MITDGGGRFPCHIYPRCVFPPPLPFVPFKGRKQQFQTRLINPDKITERSNTSNLFLALSTNVRERQGDHPVVSQPAFVVTFCNASYYGIFP